MPIRPISVTFFSTVHSFYKYVQSSQSNTRYRKKTFTTRANFFQCLFLFLRASVSRLLKKVCGAAYTVPVFYFYFENTLQFLMQNYITCVYTICCNRETNPECFSILFVFVLYLFFKTRRLNEYMIRSERTQDV